MATVHGHTTPGITSMARQGGRMSRVWIKRAGTNLRLLREQRGVNQTYVAERLCELSGDPEFYAGKEAISAIELGKETPPWHKMLQLARFFDTTIEALAELPTESRSGPQTRAEVIYVQNMNGNCVLGGLGLAIDPAALEKLGEVLSRYPELMAQVSELLHQWRTRQASGASGEASA